MKRILITIDDDTAKELAKSKNQSETVRQALKVYQSGISTETFAGIAASYKITEKRLTEIESKLNYLVATLGKRDGDLELPFTPEPILVLDSQDPADTPKDLSEFLK